MPSERGRRRVVHSPSSSGVGSRPNLPGGEDSTTQRLKSSHRLSWWRIRRGGCLNAGELAWLLSPFPLLHILACLQCLVFPCSWLMPPPPLGEANGRPKFGRHLQLVLSMSRLSGSALQSHRGTALKSPGHRGGCSCPS